VPRLIAGPANIDHRRVDEVGAERAFEVRGLTGEHEPPAPAGKRRPGDRARAIASGEDDDAWQDRHPGSARVHGRLWKRRR